MGSMHLSWCKKAAQRCHVGRPLIMSILILVAFMRAC